MIHSRAAHPAPGRVGLISTLLELCHGPVSDIAQLEPTYSGNTVRVDGVIANHRFVIAKVAIGEPKHQPVTDCVKRIAVRFGDARSCRGTEFCEPGRRNSGEQCEGRVYGGGVIDVEKIKIIILL